MLSNLLLTGNSLSVCIPFILILYCEEIIPYWNRTNFLPSLLKLTRAFAVQSGLGLDILTPSLQIEMTSRRNVNILSRHTGRIKLLSYLRTVQKKTFEQTRRQTYGSTLEKSTLQKRKNKKITLSIHKKIQIQKHYTLKVYSCRVTTQQTTR